MINLLQMPLLISEGSFGINTDILDTNVVNLALLIALLVYAGRDFLGSALDERQKEIIKGIQDAEKRLTEAESRYNEANKQLEQAQVIIKQIKQESELAKKNILESDCETASEELSRRFSSAAASLRLREQQILSDIKEQVSTLALKKVMAKLQNQLSTEEQSQLIDKGIARLGGQL
jgi:F-type H+-transporting ATPase subunit b